MKIATRVVVTGLGAVSPLGNDVPATWSALIAGRSGISYATQLDSAVFPGAIAGEVKDFSPDKLLPMRHVRHMDRSTQLGLVAALEALSDAGFSLEGPLGPRCGVVAGSSAGGIGVAEAQGRNLRLHGPRRVTPFTLTGVLADSISGHLAILSGATGPNMAVTAASATGAAAIGEAAEIIRRGDADVMLAAATEAPITPALFAGLLAMRGMAPAGDDPATACRPFDLNRRGFVAAEGAGALMLESLDHARERDARVYAELAGYGLANDAFDMAASEPSGRGSSQAMSTAVRKAGMAPDEVDYINAHGSGSKMNDRVETLAIKNVFGEHAYRLAVSSTKSMTGHLMGAAGALEAVITVLALRDSLLPATMHYQERDPDCDLDYVPNEARHVYGLEAALTLSIGLGGHNAALVFRRIDI